MEIRQRDNSDNIQAVKMEVWDMPTKIEQRLDMLVHEINDIKKELIMQKIQNVVANAEKISHWQMLGGKISEKWDQVFAVDEIRQQREKV